jgi:hypothetical protein
MRGCAGAEREDLAQEIESLGLRHRIVTRRTSLVAVSEDRTVDPQDPRRRERLAVELPYGVSAAGVGLEVVPGALCMHLTAVGDVGASYRVREPITLDQAFPILEERRLPVGRVVRRDRDLLVVEFESPHEAIDLPDVTDEVVIRWDSGDASAARIDATGSTRAGRHAAGLTLRLVLRLSDAVTETSRTPVVVRWRIARRWYAVHLAG